MLFNCAYCPSENVQILFREERLFGRLFSVECLVCRKIDLPTVAEIDDADSRVLYHLEEFPELKPILYRSQVLHEGRTITFKIPTHFELRMLKSGKISRAFWNLVNKAFPKNPVALIAEQPELHTGGRHD